MAENTKNDIRSWPAFVDSIAGPLRLEPLCWHAYGLLATLHLIRELWGEVALLRAAERLFCTHLFDLETTLAVRDHSAARVWYACFLARCATAFSEVPTEGEGPPAIPLAEGLLKPAWIASYRGEVGLGKQS